MLYHHCFFNFVLQYAVRRVQTNQEGLKLNGTHELSVYADVNRLGGSIHTIRKNREALVIASKETAEKTYVYGHVSRSERRTKWEHTDR